MQAVSVAFAMTLVSLPAVAQDSFEGIWSPRGGTRPPMAEVKLTPAGRAKFETFSADNDPALKCIMPGIPFGLLDPYPKEIVHQKHQTLILNEHFHEVRRIFMDGRKAPDDWPPSLMGFSVGHWEGKTLVVRTTHLSSDNWMTMTGLPFSGDEHTYLMERWSRDGNVLTSIASVYDPTYYMEPYVMKGRWEFTPNEPIMEYECILEYGNIQ
jgi:hypothetical protein